MLSPENQLALHDGFDVRAVTDRICQLIGGGRLGIKSGAKRWPEVVALIAVALRKHDQNHKLAASELGLSGTQLVKGISGDKTLLTWVQQQRASLGLSPLRTR